MGCDLSRADNSDDGQGADQQDCHVKRDAGKTSVKKPKSNGQEENIQKEFLSDPTVDCKRGQEVDGGRECPVAVSEELSRPNQQPDEGTNDQELECWVSNFELTDQQKDLIEETWKLLVDSIAEVGVITFMRLFETHPDVQQAFLPFKQLSPEQLHFSRELRAHALRVMGFVQKVVARLREPKEKVECLLRSLGTNHVAYGAKEAYVDLIGPQFVFAIAPSLEERWTSEVEGAWIQLFRYISDVMKDAMVRAREALSPQDQQMAT